MASGDTKTQEYLNLAATGTRADLPAARGCCNTRTQDLIVDVADRIITEEETRAREDSILQNEIDEIKNNPDVADIVATYADLQNYDTSHLTDKDVIRVLADETHDGQSTYYRYDKHNDSWTYIGEAGDYYTKAQTDELLGEKQDLLTAGDGITIEDESGALVISATGGGGGTSNFNQLTNRPSYNGVTMTGSTNIPEVKTYTAGTNVSISGTTISATDTTYSAGGGLDLTGTTFSVDTTTIQPKLTAGTNVSISAQNEISATDTTYTAGTGLDLTGTTFSADTTVLATKTDLDGKQDELTAGDNISIGEESGALVISATDTTYNNFIGTDGTSAGTAGLVPAPATTDAGKFLKADGTWDTAGGGGPTVVQTTGTSTTDVMSQNAVTSMVFADPSTKTRVVIGSGASTGSGSEDTVTIGNGAHTYYTNSVSIGKGSSCSSGNGVAIGAGAEASAQSVSIGRCAAANSFYSVGLGSYSKVTQKGQVDISTLYTTNTYGYNDSQYRLLTGLYDPQNAHDAATKGYVDGTTETYTIATSDWSALSASSPYTYQATVTATYTIGASTIAELINDSAVDFATYGFAIGSISSQSVTIYSIGQPSASVSLKVNYKG